MKYPPLLPNRASKRKTVTSDLIDLRYARKGAVYRWDWERYLRLAKFLNYTTAELASVIALPHAQMERCERNNRFAGPACILLTLIEAKALKGYSDDIIEDLFTYDSPQGSDGQGMHHRTLA